MVCMLRERERERGRGGRRGREGTETVRGGDGDGEIRTERDRDAAGRNEKAGKKRKKERKKEITKGWERWRKCSIDVLSSQPTRLYSVSLPLPSVLQAALSRWRR